MRRIGKKSRVLEKQQIPGDAPGKTVGALYLRRKKTRRKVMLVFLVHSHGNRYVCTPTAQRTIDHAS